MKSIYQTKLLAVAVATALGLSGCGIAEVRSVQKDAMRDTRAQLDAAPRSRPVFLFFSFFSFFSITAHLVRNFSFYAGPDYH